MRKLIVALAAAAMLAGCTALGIPSPQTPAQTVYTAKSDFLAAVLIANQYKALPGCAVPDAPVLCAKADVVVNIKLAANAAKATLDSAEAAVRDPAFDGNAVDKAVVAATNAVGAFVTITTQLKVKP